LIIANPRIASCFLRQISASAASTVSDTSRVHSHLTTIPFDDHAKAQGKPEIEPNRMADDLRRKTMALVERVAGCRHGGRIAARPRLIVNLTVPARDKARAIAKTAAYATSRRERKGVEMLFAHLKRILKLDRLRLRGPNGAKDEFLLAATAQNLRKLAKLIPLPAPIFAA
jgi:hypothetical protein